jgi:hypothetical protein
VQASLICVIRAESFPKAAKANSPQQMSARPQAPAALVLRGLLEVLLWLQVSLCVKKTGGEERGPEWSRSHRLRKGGRLPLHCGNGRLPLLLRSGRSSVSPWTTVVVLVGLDLLRSGVIKVAQVFPLVDGERVRRKAETRQTFGAAPKLSGTEKIPGSGIGHEKTAAACGSPSREPQAPEAQKAPRGKTKDPSVPDPETHLSVDDPSSSS